MYIQPAWCSFSIRSTNTVQIMQPPLANNSSNTNTVHLSQEHRTRLYQLVNELNDDQLRVFLTTQLPSVSNTHSNNPFQFHSRTQLIQQAYVFIDNCYSTDLEHALHTLSQKRFAIDYRQEQYQHQQQQQPPQQQQQMYRPPQQNYAASFNPQPYYYGQQPPQYNTAPNYRFPAAAPPPLQGGRTLTLSKYFCFENTRQRDFCARPNVRIEMRARGMCITDKCTME